MMCSAKTEENKRIIRKRKDPGSFCSGLNGAPQTPQKVRSHPEPLEPVIVTSFRKRVFADVIKYLEWAQPGVSGGALNPTTHVFVRPVGDDHVRHRPGLEVDSHTPSNAGRDREKKPPETL